MENNTTRRFCKECGKEVLLKDLSLVNGIVRHDKCFDAIQLVIKANKQKELFDRNVLYYNLLRKHKGLIT